MGSSIKTTENATDKYTTYRALTGRHKLAMKHGFFFEALLIDYAVLEDRLAALLWAAGALNDIDRFGLGNKRNKSQLLGLYSAYTGKDKLTNLKNISAKIDMVLAMISFAEKAYDGDNRYLTALHKGLQTLDLESLKADLAELHGWREYRNEIIHGAMTKNIYSLYEELEDKAALGLAYARTIDKESQKLKRQKHIRKSVNMPPKK